jgi:AbrB family looped-hinge helix DNA binding protein
MNTVTVSEGFEMVIPREVCEKLRTEVGTKFQVFVLDNRVALIPVRSPKMLRGFLMCLDTLLDRDTDRG